jgi:hypothetical protein
MAAIETEQRWDAALRHVLGDPDGTELPTSQALWALALRAEFPRSLDVRCGDDVLGPVRTPDGRVVMRTLVSVSCDDPQRALTACDVAWRRFALVGDDGVETDMAWMTDDPDPVGLPVIVDGRVVLGFDGREDDEPYPHRALTCLRILVEELRRHACTPVALTNAMRVPDDEASDIDALARRLADHPPVATDIASDTSTGRPTWLAPFHQVERAGKGSPGTPVPFVLLAARWVWAWDPVKGLLKVPDLANEEPAHQHFPMGALSRDGTSVQYRRYTGHRPTSPPPGLIRYDLATGATESATGPAAQIFAAGPQGPFLYAYAPERSPDGSVVCRLELALSPGGPVHDLPLQDPLTVNHDGEAVQFSPEKDRVLTSHVRPGDSTRYVAVTDLATGQSRVVQNRDVAGSVAWSPDGTRILVGSSSARWVHDLAGGVETPIPTWAIGSHAPQRGAEVRPLAWLGRDGLLMGQRYGRRIELAYQPLDGSERYPVLDLPVPGKAGDFLGVVVAADVVHRAPWLVGRASGSAA